MVSIGTHMEKGERKISHKKVISGDKKRRRFVPFDWILFKFWPIVVHFKSNLVYFMVYVKISISLAEIAKNVFLKLKVIIAAYNRGRDS